MTLNILVVDDSDVIRSMIGRTLRLAQLPLGTVHEAANGREALGVLDEHWIDLVLADINMPVMSGSEMIHSMRAREETADIPVIVVSTEGATDRVEELMRAGVSAWVRKPFTPEEIRDVVNEVASSWRARIPQVDFDDVLCTVLETFAFTFPEPAERGDLPIAGEDVLCASIDFSGAVSGTLAISAPTDLCVQLAANILGVDEGDPEASLRGADTLGEIVNIAAGHLATRIEPKAATHLHPPVVTRLDPAEWDRLLGDTDTRAYLVEDVPALVALSLRQERTSSGA